VYENGKALSTRQEQYADLARRMHSPRGVEQITIGLTSEASRERTASRAAMEHFGRTVAELLDCKSCYVATKFASATSDLDEVRVGHATADPSCVAVIERIAREGSSTDCTLITPINERTNFVRKLIGEQPGGNGHSVIGRMPVANGAMVVFVAGWRTTGLSAAEIPCVVRAIRMMWETAHAIARTPLPRADLPTWLEDLIFPAFVIDEQLLVHEVNGAGCALLAKGQPLKLDRGKLSGASSSITDNLRKAIAETLTSSGNQCWLNAMVPLSVDHQQFAFARIGAVPGDVGRRLVIVPQFDEVSGANRIASAFGLTWAEERIVARILQGRCPRQIGAELHLTEATVRTYTKRIMLKLGINRQSEFFLLYHLTLSPFGAGARTRLRHAPPPYLNGKTH
jgi:DNA-binding CsgD family transcriptional regulator